jgi:hypothetical protein
MTMMFDPDTQLALRREELLAEAEHERLLAHLPRHENRVRRELALACVRLANWLDEPPGYVQLPDPGREDWAAPWVSV